MNSVEVDRTGADSTSGDNTAAGGPAIAVDDVDPTPEVIVGRLQKIRTRLWSWRVGAILFVIYLLLAMLFWRTLIWRFGSASLGGGGGDAGLFISWLQWAAHAVTHGLNPLHNNYLQAPAGVSAGWNTSILALGIPLTPVTLWLGATTSYNLIMLLSPVLACWTAAKWLRRYVSVVPAAIGALVYGFSPFEIGQLAGHAHLTFLALIPLVIMCLEDLLVRSERPIWPSAPVLGLLLALQYFISSEILLILSLALVPAVIVLAVGGWKITRVRVKRVLIAGVAAAGTAVLLLAYPLYDQFSTTYRIDHAVQIAANFIARPRWLFTPTVALLFHGSTPAPNAVENGTYVGWPLFVLLLLTVLVLRRRLVVWVAVAVAFFAVISEVNPHLFGKSVSVLNFLQHRVELTASLLPIRFASVFALAAAFLVALAAQELLRVWSTRKWVSILGFAVVALTLTSLVPGPSWPVWPVAGSPAFFTSSEMKKIIPAGSTVMLSPMASPENTEAQTWQVDAGMWFKQLGGYGLNNQGTGVPSFYPQEQTLTLLFGSSRVGAAPFSSTDLKRVLRASRIELAASGATFFILGPSMSLDLAQQRTLAEHLLGRPADVESGGAEIWRLAERCGQDPMVGPVCPATSR